MTAVAPPAATLVLRRLREARRRLIAQRFLRAAAVSAIIGASAICVLAFARHGQLVAVVVVAALAAAIHTGLTRPTLAETAALLDARADARDRFRTALDFGQRTARTPLESLALDECDRFARDFPVARWTPIRLPRVAAWLLLPLGALALLSWGAFSPRPKAPTATDSAVAQHAAELQQIAATLRSADAKTPSPDLARVADAMEKSAQRLKTADPSSDAAKQKAALREMSSLEAMLNAMRAARDQPVSPAELSALAAALAANDATKPAADALRAGELGAAASQLEKLLQSLNDRPDSGAALQQLARSLQEQADRLTDAQKNEIARQMQAAGQGAQGGQSALSQQALSRLAQLLRQAGQNGAGSPSAGQGAGPGRPMTDRELQSLVDAMENMKNGLRPGGAPGGLGHPGEPDANSPLAIIDSFSKDANASAGLLPAGQPGSERDAGHSDSPFGKDPAPAVKAQGPATRLSGAQNDGGESLQQFIGAANDGSRATRAYREGFERLVPAAQNAVEQENIPLGSRAFVRRYFENIRPTE